MMSELTTISPQTYTIRLDGHRFAADVRGDLVSRFTTQRILPRSPDGDSVPTCRMESLVNPDERIPNGGIGEMLVYLLRAADADYRIFSESLPIPSLGEGDIELARFNGIVDGTWISMLHQRERGLVRYGRGCNVARFIAQAALAYPNETIAVATSSRDRRDIIAEELRELLAEEVIVVGSTTPPYDKRIIVSTWTDLAYSELESHARTFWFVPNALDALAQRATDALLQACARFRLFGFLPKDRKTSPHASDRLVAAFGLMPLEIPAHGFVPRPVGVIWKPFRHRPRAWSDSLTERKRQQIWENGARNRLIADAATSCSQSRHGERYFRVSLLVESVEHAIALGRRLSDWPIITGGEVDTGGLSARQLRILEHGRARATNPLLTNVIVTTSGLTAERLASTDVLVWGGAGRSIPPLPYEGMQCRWETLAPLLIIDIADRGPGCWRHHADRRAENYRARGWFAPGEDRFRASIDHFLANRPTGAVQ